MAHEIELIPRDQIILLEVLAMSCDYKMATLKSRASIEQMSTYYMDAAEKIRLNHIKINKTKSNLFTWLIDQIRFSKPVAAATIGQEAIEICRAAADNSYQQHRQQQHNSTLFEDTTNGKI